MFDESSMTSWKRVLVFVACSLAFAACSDDDDESEEPTPDVIEDMEDDGDSLSTPDGGETETDGDDADATPSSIPAEGVYELSEYRTGGLGFGGDDCSAVEAEEEVPFAFFSIEYDEDTEDFLIRSCETADDCASGNIEDSFDVLLADAGDSEPSSIATSESYNQNDDECQLSVAEQVTLVPTDDGYTWRIEDYRGSVVVPLDTPAACGVEEYDPAPLLDDLDDCPSVDEYVGVAVE